jgi:hypothetical protein
VYRARFMPAAHKPRMRKNTPWRLRYAPLPLNGPGDRRTLMCSVPMNEWFNRRTSTCAKTRTDRRPIGEAFERPPGYSPIAVIETSQRNSIQGSPILTSKHSAARKGTVEWRAAPSLPSEATVTEAQARDAVAEACPTRGSSVSRVRRWARRADSG